MLSFAAWYVILSVTQSRVVDMNQPVVYCYHCIPTGKKYVGITVNEAARKRTHRSHALSNQYPTNKFHSAIRKYGWESFTYGVIEYCPESELDKKERYYIKQYNTLSEGYNGNSGGKHFTHSEETKQRISDTHRGRTSKRVYTQEARDRIRQAQLGRGKTEQEVNKWRETMLRKKRAKPQGPYCSLDWEVVKEGLV